MTRKHVPGIRTGFAQPCSTGSTPDCGAVPGISCSWTNRERSSTRSPGVPRATRSPEPSAPSRRNWPEENPRTGYSRSGIFRARDPSTNAWKPCTTRAERPSPGNGSSSSRGNGSRNVRHRWKRGSMISSGSRGSIAMPIGFAKSGTSSVRCPRRRWPDRSGQAGNSSGPKTSTGEASSTSAFPNLAGACGRTPSPTTRSIARRVPGSETWNGNAPISAVNSNASPPASPPSRPNRMPIASPEPWSASAFRARSPFAVRGSGIFPASSSSSRAGPSS